MPKFRKLSGKHYIKGKCYVKGDVIECSHAVIKNFMDTFEEIETEDAKPDAEVAISPTLKVVHKGFGRYNVVNTKTDGVVNDRPLNKDEAESIVNDATTPIG